MSILTYSSPDLPQEVDLDLSRNEGSRAEIDLATLTDRADALIRRYPDTSDLRARLASVYGVAADSVLVTAGADDALLRCALALLGPDRTAVTTAPGFQMIPVYAAQVGARIVEIDWWDGPFPTDAVVSAAADAAAVFLVSPNNPTGSAITEGELRKVADAARFVVVDAAYVEFADEDSTAAALEMGNVVVVRTLSKAYGLAGLRVGCLLGPPPLVDEISQYGSPYPVSSLSAAIAMERLGRPSTEIDHHVSAVCEERARLAAVLEDLDVRSLPSQGNFVLAEPGDAAWVTDACAALGVGIRRFPEHLPGWVRITVPGDDGDFDRLASTLRTVLAPEALLFDLDGVLVDVSGSYRRVIVETAASFGIALTAEDVEAAKALGGANDDWELTRRLMADRGAVLDPDTVADRFEALYHGSGSSPGLKAGERPLVGPAVWAEWASTLPLGVVTGRPRSDAEEALARFDLLGAIAVLVAREDAPMKPDPVPVRLALERIGVEHAWMVGDTPDDLVAARGAGVLPIGVASRPLPGAVRTLVRTTDLEELLP